MKFLTWNIQSGGGKRITTIVAEVTLQSPDFIALTEVTAKNLHDLRERLIERGYYHVATACPAASQKNSVLVASKLPFQTRKEEITHDKERWLSIHIQEMNLNILSIHIPGADDDKFGEDGYGISGKKRKEIFWNEVIKYAENCRIDRTVILGDFNTGLKVDAEGLPFALSEYISKLSQIGYIDTWRYLHPSDKDYTWYSKRKNKLDGSSHNHNGFRLDYVFVSPPLHGGIISTTHVHSVREQKLSDHSIVVSELDI